MGKSLTTKYSAIHKKNYTLVHVNQFEFIFNLDCMEIQSINQERHFQLVKNS